MIVGDYYINNALVAALLIAAVGGLAPLQLFFLVFAATFVYWRRQNGI